MNTGNITILATRRRMCRVWMLGCWHRVTLSGRLGRVFRNILRETEAEYIARIWGLSFLYFAVNILLTYLLYVLFVQNTFMFYIVILLLFVDAVACSLIYPHESVGIRTSIPQTANGTSIVRAPGVPSSVPPHTFSLGLRPRGLTLMLYREIIAVCSQIHTKHINTVCGQNVEL
jgi:hypothetical protein